MKMKQSVAAIALSAGIFSINNPIASADPTPAPTSTSSVDSSRAAREQFRIDRDLYMTALRNRNVKLRAINETFKSAVDRAAADAKTAISTASSPDQKNSINTARRAAIAAAIVARESAIAELGPLPTPPARPEKRTKDAPLGMQEQKGKQKR